MGTLAVFFVGARKIDGLPAGKREGLLVLMPRFPFTLADGHSGSFRGAQPAIADLDSVGHSNVSLPAGFNLAFQDDYDNVNRNGENLYEVPIEPEAFDTQVPVSSGYLQVGFSEELDVEKLSGPSDDDDDDDEEYEAEA